MKTIIAACSLILTAGGALAQDSIYGDFAVGNPDLGGSQYPSTLSDPVPSRAPFIASVDEFQRGNPDAYDGSIEGYVPYFAPGGPTLTSLEVFMHGNPDLGYDVDMSLPVIGSPEAYAMAAQGCGKPTAIVC